MPGSTVSSRAVAAQPSGAAQLPLRRLLLPQQRTLLPVAGLPVHALAAGGWLVERWVWRERCLNCGAAKAHSSKFNASLWLTKA